MDMDCGTCDSKPDAPFLWASLCDYEFKAEQQAHSCVPPCSNLETRLHTMETEWETQLEGLRNERENVRQQLGQQNSSLTGIQQGLEALRNNSNLLQLQQQQLMQSLQLLKRMLEQGAGELVGPLGQRLGRKAGAQKESCSASRVTVGWHPSWERPLPSTIQTTEIPEMAIAMVLREANPDFVS